MKRNFVFCLVMLVAFTTLAESPKNWYYVYKHNRGILGYKTVEGEKQPNTTGGYNYELWCTDPGMIRCRISNFFGIIATPDWLNDKQKEQYTQIIDNLIILSEEKSTAGDLDGSATEKLCIVDNNGNVVKYLVFLAKWNYAKDGEGSVNIQVAELDKL